MIHLLEITAESDPVDLRKQFRKKLMTGGGVIRIAPGVSPAMEEEIFKRFSPDAVGHNLSAMVLEQLASQVKEGSLLSRLSATTIPRVVRALKKRTDLPVEIRAQLTGDPDDSLRAIHALARELSGYSESELRLFFQQHLGEDERAVAGRLALCRITSPPDLLWLMSRDKSREVRFAARNRLNKVRE